MLNNNIFEAAGQKDILLKLMTQEILKEIKTFDQKSIQLITNNKQPIQNNSEIIKKLNDEYTGPKIVKTMFRISPPIFNYKFKILARLQFIDNDTGNTILENWEKTLKTINQLKKQYGLSKHEELGVKYFNIMQKYVTKKLQEYQNLYDETLNNKLTEQEKQQYNILLTMYSTKKNYNDIKKYVDELNNDKIKALDNFKVQQLQELQNSIQSNNYLTFTRHAPLGFKKDGDKFYQSQLERIKRTYQPIEKLYSTLN